MTTRQRSAPRATPPDAGCSPPADRERLLSLLLAGGSAAGDFSFASDEALAAARALDAAAAGEVVSSVLEAYVPGADHALAERAAHVAHALGLAGAVPALVSCLERLPPGDRVASVSSAALELIGRAAVGPLVEAFSRAAVPTVRLALGAALVALPADDGRVRAALEALLASDPQTAAELLGSLGDRRAVPALRTALAAFALPPPGAGELEALEPIVTVGEAIRSLGGRMTAAERATFEGACARADVLFLQGERAPPGGRPPKRR